MIRYRTHDICTLTHGTCACGRTTVKMSRITGRTDDMLVIRGVNVFPSQIESVLLGVEEASAHYMIVVDRVNSQDKLTVQVELKEDVDMGDAARQISSRHCLSAQRLSWFRLRPFHVQRVRQRESQITDISDSN